MKNNISLLFFFALSLSLPIKAQKVAEYILSEIKLTNDEGLPISFKRIERVNSHDTMSLVAIKFKNKSSFDNGYINLGTPKELNSFISDLEFLMTKFNTKEYCTKTNMKYRMDINNKDNSYYKMSLSKRVFFYETISNAEYSLKEDRLIELLGYLKSIPLENWY